MSVGTGNHPQIRHIIRKVLQNRLATLHIHKLKYLYLTCLHRVRTPFGSMSSAGRMMLPLFKKFSQILRLLLPLGVVSTADLMEDAVSIGLAYGISL